MKDLHINVLLAFLIGSFMIASCQAFTLSNVEIGPQDNTLQGDQISVSFTLKPSGFEGFTSDPNGSITAITGLDSATWTRITYLNGYPTSQTVQGNTLNLQGWDIAYPGDTHEFFNISVTGKAPQVPSTGQVTVLSIAEFNQAGIILPGSSQQFQHIVINPGDLQSGIYLARKDLDTLRASIDAKKQIGIDTSSEETILQNSKSGLDLISYYPASNYPAGLARLQEINTQIKSAEDLLDRSWAQLEIDNATVPLTKLDGILRWFAGNKTTANYKGLLNITVNQTIAQGYIQNAQAAILTKDYEMSRIQSDKAYESAISTLLSALALQKKAEDPFSIIWDNELVIGLAFVVVVGIILFKPKKKRKKKVKEIKKDGDNNT